MTVPSVPYRITKLCGRAVVEKETEVYFQSFAPLFGSHMHVDINTTHFHTTKAVTLPVNYEKFFSYGPSVIDEDDVLTVPYKNFFFGVAVDNADTKLQMTLNSWNSQLTNETDLQQWAMRPAYLFGEDQNGRKMTFAYPELFSVGMVVAGAPAEAQDYSQWSRFMNATWVGDKKDYGDGGACDCDRGLPDPDCDLPSADRACTTADGKSGVCFQGVCTVVDWNADKCDVRNYGDGAKCDCGCTTVEEKNDPDCQLPMMPRRCNGVTSKCVAEIEAQAFNIVSALYTCTADQWRCAMSKYGNDEYCECGTCSDTIVDPDCDLALNYSSSCGSLVCVNNTCAYPKYWTCDPAAYNDGRVCDCACGTFDPDCLLEGAALRGCPEGDGANYTCVRVNGTKVSACERAVCGNNRTDRSAGEECDGGEGCTSECRCAPGYVQPGYSATFCVTVCGDKIVAGDEECDATPFCHASACVCLQDHPLNTTTGLCTGCGNGVVEDGEECDGGEGCTSECRCASGFRANGTAACAESRTGHVVGVALGSVFGALVLCAAIVALVFVALAARRRRAERAVQLSSVDPAAISTDSFFGVLATDDSPWDVTPAVLDFGFTNGQLAPIGVAQSAKVVLTNRAPAALAFQVVIAQSNKYALHASPLTGDVPANGTVAIDFDITLFCTTKVSASVTFGVEYSTGRGRKHGGARERTRERRLVRVDVEGQVSTHIDLDELQFEGPIGEGQCSCGVVNRGKWREHDVAIKVLPYVNERVFADFVHEVDVMEALHSDYLVPFYGGAITADRMCLVTQLMHNGNLSQFLTHYQLSPYMKIRLAHDVASGMAFLHANHLIHRNLKPTNILIASRDVRDPVLCKISDFGASRFVADEQAAATMTNMTVTPLYTAPEMMVEHGKYSMASDVFSYGIILAELWNEFLPYAERSFDSPFALSRYIIDGNRPGLRSDCPPAYMALAQACWVTDPAARPTFAQVVTILESPDFAVSQQGPHAVPKAPQ